MEGLQKHVGVTVLSLLVAGVAAPAFAQAPVVPAVATAQDKATFGVKAGLNVSTLTIEGGGADSKTGAVAGIFVGKSINKSVGIRGEALFSQKGVKGEDNSKFKLNYVDVPVLLTVGPKSSGNTRFSFVTGPQFSLNTKAEVTVSGSTFKVDVSDEIKGSDLAWVAGVGLENGRWSADVRYALGLKSIAKDSDTVKNRVLSVTVGVKFSK